MKQRKINFQNEDEVRKQVEALYDKYDQTPFVEKIGQGLYKIETNGIKIHFGQGGYDQLVKVFNDYGKRGI
jgi:hypothetical protein